MTGQAKERLDYLDGWRGLAILGVLVSHFSNVPGVHWLGTFGVELFFVLSGFLMSRILFIERMPLGEFFLRRFSRVVPTFVLFVACAYA
jgi:peptidoglycan/LPS O-acetylase OafA/YrhL